MKRISGAQIYADADRQPPEYSAQKIEYPDMDRGGEERAHETETPKGGGLTFDLHNSHYSIRLKKYSSSKFPRTNAIRNFLSQPDRTFDSHTINVGRYTA